MNLMDSWDEEKRAKAKTAMTIGYMSSEEEMDVTDSPTKKRKVIPLPWESEELRKMKSDLDEAYAASLSVGNRKRLAKGIRIEGRESSRLPPKKPLAWTLA